jgi:hypothetical protein
LNNVPYDVDAKVDREFRHATVVVPASAESQCLRNARLRKTLDPGVAGATG